MANLGANFYPKLVQISSELGMKPEDLLTVMVSESGIDPSAHEKVYNGGGLVGFMPDTLKGLKFPGSPEDFRKLSGEQQLDWVKKLVQGFMPMNGGPFTSAAQYYVANFFPVALKLPGIRQNNTNTAFIEENPETVRDPHTGKRYSKKYYDIGIKLSPRTEQIAYQANPLFHGSVKGAITYGDMVNQVNKNKRSPLYSKAVAAMHDATGYSPNEKMPQQPNMATKQDHKSIMNNYLSQIQKPEGSPINTNNKIDQTLNNYLQMITASDKSYKKLYKTLLPSNDILIKVQSEDNNNAIEFARILCTALDVELMASAYTHTDGHNVEIECKINGPQEDCFNTVVALSNSITQAFKLATKKIGGLDIKTECIMNKQSSYQQITIKSADINYRKFLLKFI